MLRYYSGSTPAHPMINIDCVVTPLHPPGMPSGYWLTNNVSTY